MGVEEGFTVDSMALAPDGQSLAVGHWNGGEVRLRGLGPDPAWTSLGKGWSGTVAFSGLGVEGFECLAFSPDGSFVAMASRDGPIHAPGKVRIVEVATGEEALILRGHNAEIWCVAYAPDGKTLATGSDDFTVKLWDVVTGDERLTLWGQTARVAAVGFSPDGRALASGSLDGTVRLWRAATAEEVDARGGVAPGASAE